MEHCPTFFCGVVVDMDDTSVDAYCLWIKFCGFHTSVMGSQLSLSVSQNTSV